MSYDYDGTNPRAGDCVTAVWGQSGWRQHQCRNKAKVQFEGKNYCRVHDPVYVAEKAKAKREKWDEEGKRLRRERCLGWLGPRAIKALKKAHEQRLAATMTKQYDGCEEVEEILRIARTEGWTC